MRKSSIEKPPYNEWCKEFKVSSRVQNREGIDRANIIMAQWNHQQFKNNIKQSTMNEKINQGVTILLIGLFAIIISVATSCNAGHKDHANQSREKFVK